MSLFFWLLLQPARKDSMRVIIRPRKWWGSIGFINIGGGGFILALPIITIARE